MRLRLTGRRARTSVGIIANGIRVSLPDRVQGDVTRGRVLPSHSTGRICARAPADEAVAITDRRRQGNCGRRRSFAPLRVERHRFVRRVGRSGSVGRAASVSSRVPATERVACSTSSRQACGSDGSAVAVQSNGEFSCSAVRSGRFYGRERQVNVMHLCLAVRVSSSAVGVIGHCVRVSFPDRVKGDITSRGVLSSHTGGSICTRAPADEAISVADGRR